MCVLPRSISDQARLVLWQKLQLLSTPSLTRSLSLFFPACHLSQSLVEEETDVFLLLPRWLAVAWATSLHTVLCYFFGLSSMVCTPLLSNLYVVLLFLKVFVCLSWAQNKACRSRLQNVLNVHLGKLRVFLGRCLQSLHLCNCRKTTSKCTNSKCSCGFKAIVTICIVIKHVFLFS